MGIIDSFISFARGLTGERRQEVESDLAALLESYSERYEFTQEELSELDRRVAEPHAHFASAKDVERIFGKPFSE